MLWIYRPNAHELLARKRASGAADDEVAAWLASLLDRGYAELAAAVPASVAADFAELFDRVWEAPPAGLQ